MFNKYYQPSKKISWGSVIAFVLLFIAVGSGLAWVYLWFNRVCTEVILSIFAALGYGAIMGFIGKLLVKKLKLHNPAAVLVAVIVGILGMTYVKWSIYDYYDYQLIAEQYDEYIGSSDFDSDLKDAIRNKKSEMDRTTAYEYFGLDYDFNEDSYTFDENWEYVQSNAYDDAYYYYNIELSDDVANYYTDEEIEELKNSTIYEYYGYDVILGSTKEDCQKNLAAAREKSASEYLEDMGYDVESFISEYYYGVTEDSNAFEDYTYETLSFVEILTHPGTLWADIKDINKVGRWTYVTSSSSSYSSATTESSTDVNGVMLWIVWIGEFLMIDLFALIMVYSQSKKIFIEQDNNWAKEFDGNKLIFANMSKMQLKSMLEQDPDNIMNLTPLDPIKSTGRPRVKLTISHSEDFTENYLNGYTITYNAQSKGYIASEAFRGLVITPKQAGMLLSIFGIEPMGRIAGDPDFLNWRSSGAGSYGGSYAQQNVAAPQQSAPSSASMDQAVTTCGSCGTQVPSGKKFCPNCGAPFESAQSADDGFDRASFDAWRKAGGSSTPSDEMDGISTDDIDLTDL